MPLSAKKPSTVSLHLEPTRLALAASGDGGFVRGVVVIGVVGLVAVSLIAGVVTVVLQLLL